MRRRLSLTARLTLFYTLVSVAVLLGLGALVSVSIDRHFVELDQEYLQDKLSLIQDLAQTSASTAALQTRLDEVLHSHRGLFVLVQQNGTPLYQPAGFRFPAALTAKSAAAAGALSSWQDGAVLFRGLCTRTAAHNGGVGELQICAVVDTHHHAHFMRGLQQSLLWYVLLASLVSGVLGWWAARNGLAPLRAMKVRAQAVTAHKLDASMPVAAVPVEMADLAQSLNAMLLRLQDDFRRLSEFSSDLAHELRTPISNLLTETQVAISQPRSAAEYRDILASNAEEFQRLGRMVSDMLLLAKTEHGLALPSCETIVVADEVQALFDFYEALAEEKQIRLQSSGAGTIAGDRLMLRRAISNLLSNALRHTPAQGEIHVRIGIVDGQTVISVENSGQQIPPELLPRLFDRFFRADKSRYQSDTDGTGLGLAITRAIVAAHGGSVAVTSDQQRSCFCLRFPPVSSNSD